MPEQPRGVDHPSVVSLHAGEEPVAEAYAEATTTEGPALDLVTGLPTLSYLVEQIQELQASVRAKRGPRRSVLADKVLIVISLAGGEDRHTTLFLRARTSSLLRSLFAEDETIVHLRQGLFAVLATERPELAAERAFLVSMLDEFEVDARVWTERVPVEGPATANLLSSLLLAGDWVKDEQ